MTQAFPENPRRPRRNTRIGATSTLLIQPALAVDKVALKLGINSALDCR
jgi:hypothetical protein